MLFGYYKYAVVSQAIPHMRTASEICRLALQYNQYKIKVRNNVEGEVRTEDASSITGLMMVCAKNNGLSVFIKGPDAKEYPIISQKIEEIIDRTGFKSPPNSDN